MSAEPTRKLSPLQQKVYDLRQTGLMHREVAEKLGIGLDASRGAYHRALAKRRGHKKKRARTAVEDKDAELGAEALDLILDPTVTRVKDALVTAGFTSAMAVKFSRRLMKTRSVGMLVAKPVQTKQLLDLASDRVHRILESIDQYDIDEASLRDKATAIGILVDKRQLLSGEPTQILSIQERGKLDELITVVVKEAQRRGLTIDATGNTPQVLPPEGEDLSRVMPHRTAKLVESARNPER